MIPSALRQLYDAYGQGHVFRFIDAIQPSVSASSAAASLEAFEAQLKTIDPARVCALFTRATSSTENDTDGEMEPVPADHVLDLSETHAVSEDANTWRKCGLKAIYEGKVAAIVLAGGQGTRLGFDGPKGCYDIGLPSKKSLFQLQAERIRRLSQIASAAATAAVELLQHSEGGEKNTDSERAVTIPWYIMTSPSNDEETRAYFKEHDYFGLPPKDVFFFQQGMMPCFSLDGKMLLETPYKLAESPDGNGGIYAALERSGALADMHRRGVQHLHVFSVDNALVKPADPLFIGCCVSRGADCGNKSTWKSTAGEKVGVVAYKRGRPCIVEYTEMSADMCNAVDSQGRLVYGAGNICNHYFSFSFIESTVLPVIRSGEGVPFHVAKKMIPYADDRRGGETVKLSQIHGIKLESFIFDVFPLANEMIVGEVDRADEFAPVKNAPGSGSDSPETARQLMSERCKRWVQRAGGVLVPSDDDGDRGGRTTQKDGLCEISPLMSYAGEGLEKLVKGKQVKVPFYIE